MPPLFRVIRVHNTKGDRKKLILDRTRKNKDIIFGAQSIKAQIGIYARPTQDFDILTKNPKKSAMEAEKQLDKQIGFDHFYAKPAMHPGTWKVKSKGIDLRKNTDDDLEIIDYSKHPRPKPKTVNIMGVMFRNLAGEKAAKLNSLRDPAFEFRHKKDADDLRRIRNFQQSQKINRIDIGFKMPKIKFKF